MATNLTLRTKNGGELTAASDGAYRAASTPDAIISGCTISVSSNVCNMTGGWLMMAGRIIEADASSWTIPVTGSGAAVVLHIANDVLTVVTKTTDSPSLVQEDINDGGTTYEAALATFTVTDSVATLKDTMPTLAKSSGILYGTSDNPPSGRYADGTLYIKYSA